MKNVKVRKCAVISLLSYLLFAIVGCGATMSYMDNDVKWLLCFAAMFVSGAIALLTVVEKQINKGANNE
jgi:hypothetical protein